MEAVATPPNPSNATIVFGPANPLVPGIVHIGTPSQLPPSYESWIQTLQDLSKGLSEKIKEKEKVLDGFRCENKHLRTALEKKLEGYVEEKYYDALVGQNGKLEKEIVNLNERLNAMTQHSRTSQEKIKSFEETNATLHQQWVAKDKEMFLMHTMLTNYQQSFEPVVNMLAQQMKEIRRLQELLIKK